MQPSGKEPAPRHLVLVGSMAAGKSSVARLLAGRLDRPLHDNDEQLVASSGHTSRDVAAREGVVALHQAESQHLLDALASPTPAVVSAAASVVEGQRCLDALRDADVVWLKVHPETAAQRMGGESHRRALGPDEVEVLTALADRRAPLYQQVAGLVVDTDDVEPREVAERVLAWLDRRPGQAAPSPSGRSTRRREVGGP